MSVESLGRVYGLLHLIGSDRAGILKDASLFVGERGGRIEEGISHTLSSEAVVLLYISGSADQIDKVEKDVPQLGNTLNLLTLFTRITDPNAAHDREALPLTLRVSSPDFVGLLTVITQLFMSHDLPIIAHHTHMSSLPHSAGGITYRHRFTVLLPPEFKRKAFIAELDELAVKADFIRDDISHSDFY